MGKILYRSRMRIGVVPRFALFFIVGMIFGFAIATMLFSSFSLSFYEAMKIIKDNAGERNYDSKFLEEIKRSEDIIFREMKHKIINNASLAYELHKAAEMSAARQIVDKNRILCMVMTNMKFTSRQIAVRETWGRHCNILLFFSDKDDPSIPTIDLKVRSKNKLDRGKYRMTVYGLQYIEKHYKGQFDWIYKCDDDTYVIIENLRSYLSSFNPSELLFYGFHLKEPTTYMHGGAGYVLGTGTLRHYFENAFDGTNKICHENRMEEYEDVVMGDCMIALGVDFVDTRDSFGRERFFRESLDFYSNPNSTHCPMWIKTTAFYPPNFGLNCCAETSIAYHHVSEGQMFLMEFSIYTMHAPQLLLLPTETVL